MNRIWNRRTLLLGGGAIALGFLAARQALQRNLFQPLPKASSEEDYALLLKYLVHYQSPEDIRGLQPVFCSALATTFRCVEARFPQAKATLRIFSGQRSLERQVVLFLDKLATKKSVSAVRKTLAIPGSSQHNLGLATDIDWDVTAMNKPDGKGHTPFDKNPKSPIHAFLFQNQSSLGIHFPLKNEPWHIEPAGVPDTRAQLAENRRIFLKALEDSGIINANGKLQMNAGNKNPLYSEFRKLWFRKGVYVRASARGKKEFAAKLIAALKKENPGYPFFPDLKVLGIRATQPACPLPPKAAMDTPSRRGFLFSSITAG